MSRICTWKWKQEAALEIPKQNRLNSDPDPTSQTHLDVSGSSPAQERQEFTRADILTTLTEQQMIQKMWKDDAWLDRNKTHTLISANNS